jgi:hypothetical protein
MTDIPHESEPSYHLILGEVEVGVARTALNLLISNEAHEPQFRRLAREVLADLQDGPGQGETVTIALAPRQMRIMHTAVKLLFDDLQREQSEEREVLRGILDKLPDQHSIRAIGLD